VLSTLKIRDFRCFDQFELRFQPGLNFIVGPNARGKTSLLESACVLLRLQSPRVASLSRVLKYEKRGFVTDGHYNGRHLQFYYSKERKKLALDAVEQKKAKEWLEIGRVVWFGNDDIELVRGGAEKRRRFLDFTAMQLDPVYRTELRAYEYSLRSRNHLLKERRPAREIAAFDEPLLRHGDYVSAARRDLLLELGRDAAAEQQLLSLQRENLQLDFQPGDHGDFTKALELARDEDLRLRQTTVGTHRDDVRFSLNGISTDDASEGQQRSLVLALKLGAARLIERRFGNPPLLLMDDIFGELDIHRRNALLAALPQDAQAIITTTHLDWVESPDATRVLQL